METSTIVLLSVIMLIAILMIRRRVRMRSIMNYHPHDLMPRKPDNASVLLLDVRSSGERQVSSIAGSVHIPLPELESRIGELEKYRGRRIVCFCQSGSRSVTAALLLHRFGYDAGNLRGGIAEWNYHLLQTKK